LESNGRVHDSDNWELAQPKKLGDNEGEKAAARKTLGRVAVFSKRGSIGGSRHWDRTFLSKLGTDLAEAGFTSIVVKLPVNLEILIRDEIPVEQRIESELKKREITLVDFLNRERNYPAVVLVAKNPTTTETIKVLFVNTSVNANFMDATFPSGHSVPSQLYVQCSDPASVYGLYHFLLEYINRAGQSTAGLAILGISAMFLAAGELLIFILSGKPLLQRVWNLNPVFDITVFFILLYLQYRFFKAPTGLSVNDRETATFSSFIQRAAKGELKDNPMFSLILGVIASAVAAIILKIVGWP
jgi:hypothetical protein